MRKLGIGIVLVVTALLLSSCGMVRSSWDGTNGAASLETDLDGTPVLTPQSVISQYAVELKPEVTAVYDTGKLTVDGKSAAYIDVELITGTDPNFTLKGRLVRILSDGIAYDFLYTSSPDCYDEYLEAAQGILDSVRFKTENPVKEIVFGDISMCYAENDVEATVSDEKVYLYYRRYNDNIPRFFTKHDTSMRYTDDMLDDPVRLQEFIELWLLDLADPWFEENKNLQEVQRENIEVNGKRAVHVVFVNDYRHIEIMLFVHNNALYVIMGEVEFGYKDALTSFIQPIIESVRFAEP